MSVQVGMYVVSRECGMVLYGRVDKLLGDDMVSLTRLWRKPYSELDAHDERDQRPYNHWHRTASMCRPYDFARGPLHFAHGEKITRQPAVAPAKATRPA
ncbi:hypothetical protein [Deinococcus sp. UR1]|uniref:hypothetical protein n=1 Tax=Deinococcus sp. UR1 TaxID=1704277 RepID=UPI000C18B3D6|nr:hypothetical protein [Deinococcus sp. UR1]PIG96859.1 hypothetical protein AMD26_015120 [Deinococcus sp. UR1]